MSAKGMEKLIRQRLKELDELQAIWDHLFDPVDTLHYLADDTVEQAARAGLDFYKTLPVPNRLTINDLRWWLTASLKALKTHESNPNDLLTVTEVARRLKINRDKVLGWINYGRLKAKNTAKGALGRPRWRIKLDDLEDFLAGRSGVV